MLNGFDSSFFFKFIINSLQIACNSNSGVQFMILIVIIVTFKLYNFIANISACCMCLKLNWIRFIFHIFFSNAIFSIYFLFKQRNKRKNKIKWNETITSTLDLDTDANINIRKKNFFFANLPNQIPLLPLPFSKVAAEKKKREKSHIKKSAQSSLIERNGKS